MTYVPYNAFKSVMEFEGIKLKAYLCPANVWTIGYGHTEGVKQGDEITSEQAEKFLYQDLIKFAKIVTKYVNVLLTANQYAALISFVYNVGEKNFKDSTLLSKLNKKEYSEAGEEFDRWIYSNGKKLQGLKKRREKEKELFLS